MSVANAMNYGAIVPSFVSSRQSDLPETALATAHFVETAFTTSNGQYQKST